MQSKEKKTGKHLERVGQGVVLCCLLTCSIFLISAQGMSGYNNHIKTKSLSEKYTDLKINIEQAREIVQTRHGGVPLRIWLKELNGKKCYYVRILLPEGKVHTYAVDAQTGDEILR